MILLLTCVDVHKILHAEIGQAAVNTISGPHRWLGTEAKTFLQLKRRLGVRVWVCEGYFFLGTDENLSILKNTVANVP